MSQKAPSAPRGHVTESSSESGSVPVFPRAPKPKSHFPTGPAASSRRPPPAPGTNLSRNHTSRFNYNNTNNNSYGGVNKPPHTSNFQKSRYNSRYGNNNNNNNLPSGPQQMPANPYQHRNGPPPYANPQQQPPSRYQGTNEKFYQHHTHRDPIIHNNNNNKNSSKPRLEEARSSRVSGVSAPLPRGPAMTQAPPPPPSISTPGESIQQNRPQEREQDGGNNQESSKDGSGTSDNNRKDIADLY